MENCGYSEYVTGIRQVILIEQDSVSSTFKSGVFKPFPGWVMSARRMFGWSKKDVEYNFLHKYYHVFPKVIIKPMDVAFNGTEREKYIHEYLQLEKDFEVAVSEAYDRKEMLDYQANVHLARKQLEAFAAARVYGSLQDINADSTTEAIGQLDILENVHFKALAPKREQLNFKILDINGAEMTFPSKISPWIKR
jgi:hypothetical protein